MWMFSAAPVTVSEGRNLSLWSSSTNELRSQTQLSGLQRETSTPSVLIQRQGRMTVGFSGGSLSMVHIYLFNSISCISYNIQKFDEPDNRSGNHQTFLLHSKQSILLRLPQVPNRKAKLHPAALHSFSNGQKKFHC